MSDQIKHIDTVKKEKFIQERIDELELELRQQEQVKCPLIHRFCKGFYIREIYMPADSLIVSKIHKTEHPFIISAGVVHVKTNDGEWERLEAPYSAITMPGTRRILYIESDCVWTTIHRNDSDTQDLDELEDMIIQRHENHLLQPLNHKIMKINE